MLESILNFDFAASAAVKYIYVVFRIVGSAKLFVCTADAVPTRKMWLVHVSGIIVASMGKMLVVQERKTSAMLEGVLHSEHFAPHLSLTACFN